MRILLCSSLPTEQRTAGRNRLMRMSRALALQGIEATLVGAGSGLGTAWSEVDTPGFPAIAYDPELTGVRRHSPAMTRGARAARFYGNHLAELIKQYSIDGIITYDAQAQVIEAIHQAATKHCFVVADMVELFAVNLRRILNGISYQQRKLCVDVLPKLDGLIGISHGWCEWAERHGLPHVWCPSFAEDNKFFRTEPSPADQPFILGSVGYWPEREVPETFLKAILICAENGTDVQLNVIGNTGKTWQERKAMRFLRANPELLKRVNFLGFMSGDTLEKNLAEVDAFVLLRPDNRETDMLFPTRLPELMVTANPVILSKVRNFYESFQHHHDVCFVSSLNRPEEVAEEIMFLAENPEKRLLIGQNSRNLMLDQFSFSRLGSRLAAFLQEIDAGFTSHHKQ